MSITGKLWGTTQCVIATPVFEKHKLEIRPRHRCSLHRHRTKWNSFTVISGRLFIDVVKKGDIRPAPPVIDTTELGPGDSTTVAPGEFHRFRTGDEACIATEEYYPETLSEDIERQDQGGPIPDGE